MQHFYKTIPGFFDFADVYSRMVRIAPECAHFVEIGTYKGRSAVYMAVEIVNSGKNIKFDCVDSWEFIDDDYDSPDYIDKENAFGIFQWNIRRFRNIVKYHKMTSVEASELYKDRSLDFVFIDASHLYYFVMEDLKHWYPKIKIGGIIAGHDILFPGVQRAINTFFGEGNYVVMNNSWLYIKAES